MQHRPQAQYTAFCAPIIAAHRPAERVAGKGRGRDLNDMVGAVSANNAHNKGGVMRVFPKQSCFRGIVTPTPVWCLTNHLYMY